MKRANAQILFRTLLFLAVFCVIAVPVRGQLKPIETDPSEKAWVERYLDYMHDDGSHADLLDQEELVRKALRPFQLNAQQLQKFNSSAFGQTMLNTMRQMLVSQNGSFTFLRFRTVQGQRTALFRMTSEGGLNYVDWFLDKEPDGKTLAFDYNSFSTGEFASEALRRMWTPLVAEMDPEIKKHMGKKNRELAAHFDEVTGIRQACLAQDHETALKLYNKLPQSLQENKLSMLLVMNAIFQSGDLEGYVDMLDKFMKAHPDASNLEIVYLDFYYMNEQYDEVLKTVDALDQRVGGDVYLDLYRSNAIYMLGDYDKASRLIDRGLEADRWMEDFYWAGAEQALQQEDWARVSKMLSGVESIGVELLDLTEVEGFEGYVTSNEYMRWLTTRKPKAGE